MTSLHAYEDQRAAERFHLMFHTPVIDCTSQTNIGVLADISLNGMRVVGEHPIPPGEEISVRLRVPVDTGSDEDLVVTCQSRWSRRVAYIDCFHTGFQIIDAGDVQSSQLAMIIEEFGIGNRMMN